MKRLRAADLFCGAGGTSTGLMQACDQAGLKLDLLAVNHWPRAVETHAANHPGAKHLCETLDSVDPRKVVPGGKLDLLLASPECTHHSQARGGKPRSDQSRATAWHVVRWADALRPRWIIVEAELIARLEEGCRAWLSLQAFPCMVCYHARQPQHDGQEVAQDRCDYLHAPCYCDGSALAAEEVWDILRREGDEGVWRYLRAVYRDRFGE